MGTVIIYRTYRQKKPLVTNGKLYHSKQRWFTSKAHRLAGSRAFAGEFDLLGWNPDAVPGWVKRPNTGDGISSHFPTATFVDRLEGLTLF